MAKKDESSLEEKDRYESILKALTWLFGLVALFCFMVAAHAPLAKLIYNMIFNAS